MAGKIKISNDLITTIGSLLLSLVPAVVKLFSGNNKSKVKGLKAWTGPVKEVLTKLTPLAKIGDKDVRGMAKFFEELGGTPVKAETPSASYILAYEGGVFNDIADTLRAAKAHPSAGKASDQHLESAAIAAIKARDALGLLASELYTVADHWGK